MHSRTLGQDTPKPYTETEYAPTCQNNECLTSQYGQISTSLATTSTSHTTNGMLRPGKWVLVNKSTEQQ